MPLDYLNKITEDSKESVVKSLLGKFKKEIEIGIKEGKSSNQVAKDLQDKYKDIRDKASANAIARTSMHGAYNHGVIADTFDDPAITAYRFVAIVDDRTTDICSNLANKIIPKDEIMDYLPPLHFGCRSTLQPIYITEKIDPKNTIKEFKKTKAYKDKVEKNLKEKFNQYHNEYIKAVQKEKPKTIKNYIYDKAKDARDYTVNLILEDIKDKLKPENILRIAAGFVVDKATFALFPPQVSIPLMSAYKITKIVLNVKDKIQKKIFGDKYFIDSKIYKNDLLGVYVYMAGVLGFKAAGLDFEKDFNQKIIDDYNTDSGLRDVYRYGATENYQYFIKAFGKPMNTLADFALNGTAFLYKMVKENAIGILKEAVTGTVNDLKVMFP
ncbi:MAG TPA: minor capsid protein, partial [Bacteroidales bacterium]|nr:minor capsid protein [Bacteroidales bacterium]